MTTTPVDDTQLKARHRTMWASGDYGRMVQTFLTPLGPRLVGACGILPGADVLDVAAGTGNASLPAAALGARVTASDLTPELLEQGRQQAEASGLALDWVEADAEHLPFDDTSYDVVLSAIGVMFAPHHQEAADELVRVCRPGGTVGLLCWTPEGMLGALFRTMKPFAAPPPPGAQPPPAAGERGAPGRAVRGPRAVHDPHAGRPGDHGVRAPAAGGGRRRRGAPRPRLGHRPAGARRRRPHRPRAGGPSRSSRSGCRTRGSRGRS